MSNGQQLYDLGLKHVGEKYSFGAMVPKNYPDYKGPWDCAEFASWLVYQVSERLYGCANNAGHPASADAYSGFWARDAEKVGKKISVQEAAVTPGAAVVRVGGIDLIGHVVISNGYGMTVEAHSTKLGVITSSLDRRRWDFGVLIPWIEYSIASPILPPIKKPGKIYRWTKPMMEGDKIKEIQRALGIEPDGFYGSKTFNAVRAFQKNSDLVADGEVGPTTAAKLGVLV
jgi:N-acetylmuramoyl-L-alanine amidase